MCNFKYQRYRYKGDGNFPQADIELARLLNNEETRGLYGDLYERLGTRGGEITQTDIENYRRNHKLTWHEENDTMHMDLVSSNVNGVYGHLGGTSEKGKENEGREYIEEDNCG